MRKIYRKFTDSKSTSKEFPGYHDIFWLSDGGDSRHFRAALEISVSSIGITRGEVSLAKPIRARWKMGCEKPLDIIFTSHAAPILINSRVRDLFSDKGYSGWSTYDIHLSGKHGELIPDYHGLVAHGRCGGIDDSRSIKVDYQRGERSSLTLKGLYFDPKSWDGSDIFIPGEKNARILVTRRVRETLENVGLANAEFVSIDEIERLIL